MLSRSRPSGRHHAGRGAWAGLRGVRPWGAPSKPFPGPSRARHHGASRSSACGRVAHGAACRASRSRRVAASPCGVSRSRPSGRGAWGGLDAWRMGARVGCPGPGMSGRGAWGARRRPPWARPCGADRARRGPGMAAMRHHGKAATTGSRHHGACGPGMVATMGSGHHGASSVATMRHHGRPRGVVNYERHGPVTLW